jgi:hypothetical protein
MEIYSSVYSTFLNLNGFGILMEIFLGQLKCCLDVDGDDL